MTNYKEYINKIYQTFLGYYYVYWDSKSQEAKAYYKDIVSKKFMSNDEYSNVINFLTDLYDAYVQNKPHLVSALIDFADKKTIRDGTMNEYYSGIFYIPDIAKKVVNDPSVNLKKIDSSCDSYYYVFLSKNVDIALLETMIKKGFDTNKTYKTGMFSYTTPLLEAIKLNYTDHALLLINHGANITYSSESEIKTQPIFEAILQKNSIIVSHLLAKGVNPIEKFSYFRQDEGNNFSITLKSAIEVAKWYGTSSSVLELLDIKDVAPVNEILATISLETAKTAAIWYEQYLPGVKSVCLSDIYANNPMEPSQLKMLSVLHSMSRENHVTQEQRDLFRESLAKKIAGKTQISLYTDYHEPITNTHSTCVIEAMKESGIKGVGLQWFPHKTNMQITADGNININHEPITNTHSTCVIEAQKSSSFKTKLMVLRQETNIHTNFRDLSSTLAECNLMKKCKEKDYEPSVSYKAKLSNLGLYPWDNVNESKIKELCKVMGEIGDKTCYSFGDEL